MNKTIINPLTGRRIAIGKATYKKVMKLRDNISSFQQTAIKQTQDIKKKQNKAREYLLKLNLQELQRDIKKQQKETKAKNKEAIEYLLELNRQELERDVSKQQTKERNEETQQTLLKLNIQELKRLAKKQLLQNIAKKQATQDVIKKHDEFETKILMVPRVNNVAFKRALKTYIMKPIESNKYNYEQFINDIKYNATNALKKELKKKRGIRAQFTLLCKFYLSTDEEQQLTEKNFNTACRTIVNTMDIDQSIEEYKEDLMRQISEFEAKQSGWVFDSVIFLEINIYKYRPLKGSSYIDLPDIIKNKKACLNVKNTDQKCFLYSVILHDNPTIRNIDRGERVFKSYIDKYNNDGIDYPMTLEQISKFEKQNNKTINVYTYDIISDEETKKEKIDPYHIYLSKNKITNYKDCCNLLLIQEGAKSHYVLIKNLSALLSENNSKHKSYVCPSYFYAPREESKLQEHLKNGCIIYGQKVDLPSKQNAKEHVQFKNMHRMVKKPFVIYADFESLLLNVERDENASTQKYQKHEACGYAYKRVSTVDKFDKPLQLYRGDSTENVAEHFINAIVKESDEIHDIMSKIIPMDLTEDEEKQFKSSTSCYLCGIKYNDEDIKCRDHDHLTGKYRGSAHQQCN